MPTDRVRIAQHLRDARENRRITQMAAARHIGLSRSLVAQIELGNRDASAEELSKLAALYEVAVVDLVGADIEREDDVLLSVFDRAPEFLEPAAKRPLEEALLLFRRARVLEQQLGRIDVSPPRSDLASPRSPADAIVQGERLAQEERLRLGLGSLPVGDLAWLAAATGGKACHVELPADVTGLSLCADEVGIALVISRCKRADEDRYSWAQQYAHALITRGPAVAITKRGNARELAHVRAAAFASAFLLPASGIVAWLSAANKAQPSRRQHVAYSLVADETIKAEVRSTPGSQTVGLHDAAAVARTFGAPYKSVVHRLLGLGLLSDTEASALLRPKAVTVANELATLAEETPAGTPELGGRVGRYDVRVEIVEMAIEAYRRRLVDKAGLAKIAGDLQMPALPPERLLRLAETAR